MRILIHALALRKQGGGSRHLRGFTAALGRFDPESQYTLYLDQRFPFESAYQNVQVKRVSIRSQWHRLWWDQLILSRVARQQRIDLILAVFVFGSFRPPCPQIVFQRNALFFCHAHLAQTPARPTTRVAVTLRRQAAYLTMCASQAIVTPSKAMRDLIGAFYPHIPTARFAVIPHAFDVRDFVTAELLDAGINQQLNAIPPETLKLLYVSHLESHKGFDVLLEAARLLNDRHIDFRLFTTMDARDDPGAFERHQKFICAAGLAERVINLGRVPENRVHHLYRAADIFVFPSLCESFGFPLKEALATGLPIVAAQTDINQEICGQAALYYPPRAAPALADALQRLITSHGQRARLRQLATEQFQATTLDWQSYVTRVLALMQSVTS